MEKKVGGENLSIEEEFRDKITLLNHFRSKIFNNFRKFYKNIIKIN